MGVKKKEEKKQEDIIDLSTLPPCRTLLCTYAWHSYMSSLNKHLKLSELRCITREDLLSSAKEKTLDPTPSNLALICKTKIEELQLPIRKEKKDTQRKDESKFDLILVLKNYPVTQEECQELDQTDNLIEIFLYLRPAKHRISVQFTKKQEMFNIKLQEIQNAGGDTSNLFPPPMPDLYPGALLSLYKLSQHKNSYKQLFIGVEELDIDEDLEYKEEIKEEKEEVKKKDAKAPVKKGEEPKEEEIDPNDPKIKFCVKVAEKIKSLINSRVEYESLKNTVNLIPLFPESAKNELRPSKSQVSISSSRRSEAGDKQVASQDDIQKNWDFSYFYACVNQFPEKVCDSFAVQSCILRWICRDSLDSTLFLPLQSGSNAIKIIEFNDFNEKKTENTNFYLSQENLPDTVHKIIKNLTIPELNNGLSPVSENIRLSQTTSLQHFSSFSSTYFERCLNILEFEKLLKKIHPERTWDLGERRFEEAFSKTDFFQVFLQMKIYEPEILTEYIERTDSLLVAVLFRTPPGRIIRKAWKSPWKVFPNFSQFLNLFEKTEFKQFYNIDPSLVGCIKERTKIMYPADNSVIKMIEYHISGKNSEFTENPFFPRFRPIVYKDNWYFGIRRATNNEFWANFDNEKILAEMTESGLETTFTLPSGLIVKFFPSGEVLQQCPGSEEENRVIFPNGSVARYKKDGSIQLLMPSGEVSVQSKEKLWIITNNKGKRIGKRGRQLFPMDPINVTTQIDAETLAKVVIREDLVLTLKFSDGSTGVFHEDGTRIYTSSNKNTVFVECPGYAPIRVFKDPIKARQNTVIGLGSSDSGLGAEDLMIRSNDGVLIETFLQNGTKVQSILQKQELEAYNQFATNRINLAIKSDGSIIKTSQDGEVVLITAQARDQLAVNSGKDAYFFDIFTLPEERNSGVFTAQLDKGKLFTKDNEGNYFEVNTDGRAIERLAVSLNVEDEEPPSPTFEGEEYIDPECKFLPPPSSIIPPRVFLMSKDKVTEFLEQSQLDYHFRNFKGNYLKEDCKEFISHTWIAEQSNEELFAFPDSPFEKYSLPKLVKPMLQTLLLSDTPKPVSYVKRNVREFWTMDSDKRNELMKNLQKFEDWKKDRVLEKKKYEIVDPRNSVETGKFENFMARLAKFRGQGESKTDKEEKNDESKNEEDKFSEYFVEISEDEQQDVVVQASSGRTAREEVKKVANLKMEPV